MERVRVSSAVLGWSVSSALSVLGRRRSGSVTVIKSASSIRGVSLKWVHDRSRRLDNKSWHLSPHGCAAAVSADVLPASIFTPDIRQVQQLAVNLKPQSDGSTDPRYSTRGEQRRSGSTNTFRKTRMNLFFSSPGAVCSQPVQLLITALKCCLSTRGRNKYGYWCFTARPDVVCLWYQTLSNVLARHVRPALTLNILQPVGPAEMTRVLVTLCLWRCWKDARMKVFVTSWQVQVKLLLKNIVILKNLVVGQILS